jgi:hypothetical protein
MKSKEEVLKTEYLERFDDLRKNRMYISHFKYGHIKENAINKNVDYIASLEKRLKAYKETGNTEFLADVANFAMIEFMYPQHLEAHYNDISESPGLVGMSTKEAEHFKEYEE